MKSAYRNFIRCLRSPVFQIVCLGMGSWFVYLHLALEYPMSAIVPKTPLTDFGRINNWSVPTLADFVLSTVAVVDMYLLAFQILRKQPRDRRLLWLTVAFGALSAVTLMTMYPITATDVFEYVFHSRILVHYGQNPLSTPPMVFKGDPFLKTVNWAQHPSPYGPLWVILTVPGSILGSNDLLSNLYLMRALPVIFYVGSALAIAAILRTKDKPYQVAGTMLFAWNPLVLFDEAGNGHNGIIMMFFALVAIYMLVKKHWLWVIPILVASVLVKFVTAILLLPFLIFCLHAQEGNRNRIVFLIKAALLSAFLAVILTLPFLTIPSGLLEEANFYSLLAVPTLAYNILKGIQGDVPAKILTIGASVGAYLIVYAQGVIKMARDTQPRRLMLLSTWLLVAYLGIACMPYQPWFTVWPIAIGIWVNHSLVRRVLVAFTFSALLSYAANFLWIWNIRTWVNLQVNIMFVLIIFLPPLIVGVSSRFLSWRTALAQPALHSEA